MDEDYLATVLKLALADVVAPNFLFYTEADGMLSETSTGLVDE